MRGYDGRCPECGHKLDADTWIGDEEIKPKSGDVSVCAYCATFLVFRDDLSRRVMSWQEVADLDDETRNTLVRLHRAIEQRRLK